MAFPDLFADDNTCYATGLELGRYICATYRNWDNYKPEDEIAASNEDDEEPEDIKELLGNQYALYGVYN